MPARLLLALLMLALGTGTAAPEAGGARQVSAGGFAATLVLPQAVPDPPVVLIVAGSGPTDRDGNNPFGVAASYLEKLAAALAAHGIASLRYDKRGAGQSPAVTDESVLTLQTYVDDAGAVFDWLRAQPGLGPIVIAGHSEGGLIALELAAARRDVAGLVLLATPGRPPAQMIRDQLAPVPEPLRARALDILARLEAGGSVEDVPVPLHALFRPPIQNFLRSLLALDPAARLHAFPGPVLVAGGGRDLQVGRADFDALAGTRPRAERLWLAGMNHVLVEVDDDVQANLAAYADPHAELAPGLAEAIAGFVERAAGR